MYPMMLQLLNRKVVVVGGGTIAYRKVLPILQQGAHVVVVSPTLNVDLKLLWRSEQINWINRPFKKEDVQAAFLVFAATNDYQVNKEVANSCEPYQLLNIVDDPKRSTFHVPAIHQQSHLTIAVSTNGISPTLAKKIRDEIAVHYDEQLDHYFDFLRAVRHYVKDSPLEAEQRRIILSKALADIYKENEEERAIFLNEIALLNQI